MTIFYKTLSCTCTTLLCLNHCLHPTHQVYPNRGIFPAQIHTLAFISLSRMTIPTRFLLLSDTHNLSFTNPSPTQPLLPPTPAIDVLHAGDMTQVGGIPSYKGFLALLAAIPAELKLVIAGNHDLDLDEDYVRAHLEDVDTMEEHDAAVAVVKGEIAREAGVTYLTEGAHTFSLSNGAKSTVYASPYSLEYGDWAFMYWKRQDGFNLTPPITNGGASTATNPIPDFPNVDILMTHGPPKGLLDWCPRGGNVGCPHLLRSLQRSRPLMHVCGHIHEGNGMRVVGWEKGVRVKDVDEMSADEQGDFENAYPEVTEVGKRVRGRYTVVVNASIMDAGYEPTNKPWVVDLELPHAGQGA